MNASLFTLAIDSNIDAEELMRCALLQLPNWMRVAKAGDKHSDAAKHVIKKVKHRIALPMMAEHL